MGRFVDADDEGGEDEQEEEEMHSKRQSLITLDLSNNE